MFLLADERIACGRLVFLIFLEFDGYEVFGMNFFFIQENIF